MKSFRMLAGAAAALALTAGLAGCASGPAPEELDQEAVRIIRSAFRDEGIAKVDRLDQDAANEACSRALGKEPAPEVVKAIEAESLKTIRPPGDGKYLGDWREGEKIAQSGRGLTFTDDARVVNGGNCYNCHQISRQEISFGTIGPSLYQYGRLRGVTDPYIAGDRKIFV